MLKTNFARKDDGVEVATMQFQLTLSRRHSGNNSIFKFSYNIDAVVTTNLQMVKLELIGKNFIFNETDI